MIAKLRDSFDWVICDSPAGIEKGASLAMRFADAAVIVTNPEIASIHDSNRIIAMLDSQTQKAATEGRLEKHLLITRYDAVRATRADFVYGAAWLRLSSNKRQKFEPSAPRIKTSARAR